MYDFPSGDKELTDKEIHDRDVEWLRKSDGMCVMVTIGFIYNSTLYYCNLLLTIQTIMSHIPRSFSLVYKLHTVMDSSN